MSNTNKDNLGTTYQGPTNKPAGHGDKVVIHGPNGGQTGTMLYGSVVPDKK